MLAMIQQQNPHTQNDSEIAKAAVRRGPELPLGPKVWPWHGVTPHSLGPLDLSFILGSNHQTHSKAISAASHVEPPQSHLLTMFRLNCGVAIGTITALGLLGAGAVLSHMFLGAAGFTGLLKTWYGLGTFSTIALTGIIAFYHSQAKKHPEPTASWEGRRVLGILSDLCRRNNLVQPRVIFNEESGWGALLDIRGKRDVIILNPEKIAALKDRELEGLLAHELSHSNRNYTTLHLGMIYAQTMVTPGVWLGSMAFLRSCLGSSNCFTSALAWAVAFIAANHLLKLFKLGVGLLWNIASRANESKTDLRAAQLTNDPDGIIALFKRLRQEEVISKDSPISWRKLLSHPPTETRISRLRGWFQRK